MKPPRRPFREERACWHRPCGRLFTATRKDLVFCSAKCGRNARGLDAYGRPICVGHLSPRRVA